MLSNGNYGPDTLKQLIRYVKRWWLRAGLDVTPLEKLVKSVLDEDRIRRSHVGLV